ncbi:hypothetical protein [Citricoccus nitrophenolicus]|uniref:hypothetical protein n=1 Tax=Citricoccus nitrophenolicus TaxID=863575 RepID=UPI0039B3C7F8
MSGHYADHYPKPTGSRRSWRYTAQGPGRWCIMEHPLGQPAGMLFVTDAEDAVGFLPNGHALNTSIALEIQEAVKSGMSSPSIVFDTLADRATISIAAEQFQHSEDLGTVANQYSATGQAPKTTLET